MFNTLGDVLAMAGAGITAFLVAIGELPFPF